MVRLVPEGIVLHYIRSLIPVALEEITQTNSDCVKWKEAKATVARRSPVEHSKGRRTRLSCRG
jgi:hypothetical protein